jgi:hypothetical protein
MSESFDSYTAGSGFPCATAAPNCSGPNGFYLWDGAEASRGGVNGPNNGTISTTHAHSAPNSLQLGPAVDVVQTGNVTSGQWKISVWTWVTSPTNGQTYDQAYIIVMNNYQPPTVPTNNNQWSIQVGLDRRTGLLTDFNTNATYGALVMDQWVQVEITIDIDADTYSVKYNGAPAYGPLAYSTALGAGGLHAIQCLDLYAEDATGIFYDDVVVAPVGAPCYANCDHSTTAPCLNVLDFGCFLNKFAGGDTYANCDNSTTVPILNVLDFGCFLNKFAAGCSNC